MSSLYSWNVIIMEWDLCQSKLYNYNHKYDVFDLFGWSIGTKPSIVFVKTNSMRVRLNRVYRRFLFADLVHVLVTDVSWIVYLMLVQIIPNTRCLTFYYIFDNYVSQNCPLVVLSRPVGACMRKMWAIVCFK